MQLLVPNGPQPYSWVVLLSVELHVRQLLQCSVLQLSVNNNVLPVCSGREMYTEHFKCSFVSVVQLSLYEGEEAPSGYARQL